MYVARSLKYFEDEGLSVRLLSSAGGGPHLQAVLAAKAQFTASPGTYQLNALKEEQKLVGVIDLLNRCIIGVVINKDVAQRIGVTESMPFEAKIKRLKGLTLGITRPGALTDNVARHVTLLSEPAGETVRVGIHWRSGAAEALVVRRSASAGAARRTPTGAIELVRRQSERSDEEVVAELTAAGFMTGTGRPFDVAAVRWLRHVYRIPQPPGLGPGEVTVADVAGNLGVAEDAVYYWIAHGQLDARRNPRGRCCVPFPTVVREACRQRVLASPRIKPRTQTCAAGGTV